MLTLASPRPLEQAVYPFPLWMSALGRSGRSLAASSALGRSGVGSLTHQQ